MTNQLITFAIVFITSFLSTIIFIKIDDKYNIRLKYFLYVAKNRVLFSIFLILWFIVLIIIVIKCSNYFVFALLILYFTIFTNLYHKVRNWKTARKIYIENIDLLKSRKIRKQ